MDYYSINLSNANNLGTIKSNNKATTLTLDYQKRKQVGHLIWKINTPSLEIVYEKYS